MVLLNITIAAVMEGIALVALLLLFNMSISVETLNGLVFYAKVAKSIPRPSQEQTFFHSVYNIMFELGVGHGLTWYFSKL